MAGPLAGVRVAEVGAATAVAYAGKLLRDLGADVVQISDAGAACPSDAHVVFCGSTDRGTGSASSVETLKSRLPDAVIVSLTPFGIARSGENPADDLTLQALGGISLGIGLPRQPPLKLPGDQTAFQAGLSGAIAALAGLFSRQPALIDVAAADVWAAFYSGVDVALAHFGRYKKRRAGQRVRGQPYPRTLFRCKDGYFAIQCGESRHWQSFLRMIGRDDLQTHPLFSNRFKANDEHGDACDALLQPWFDARTKEEILQACLAHKIPGAPVYNIAEVAGHPHLRERAFFIEIETPRGRAKLPGNVHATLSRASGDESPRRPATEGVAEGARAERKAQPLAGIRVVDFGWVWAGAVPGHILADLGAQVIKVESASPLDYMRQGRPIIGKEKDPEQNPMFHNVNRGKLSLRIRLDHPDSRAVLRDLVATSDVVIENFSPGVMEKFGLSYRELQSVRSDVIMCSMSAVGQDGPLRGIRTYATMIASLAGLDSLVAYPGGRVLGSQSSYADPNASLHAVLGILAALWRRERTGEGAFLDLSQWEAAVAVLAEQFAEYAASGVVPEPQGTRHPRKVPHGHYPTAGDDQWIAISVANDEEWRGLARALGAPAWMGSERFSHAEGRRAAEVELEARLGEETSGHERDALHRALREAGVPAAPLLDATRLARSEHYRTRALFEDVPHPVLGSVPVYRLPWHVDGAPLRIARRAPLLGEHNDWVLKQVLRYRPERVEALVRSGVFS
jgi:crotonobetainyl-CoA:carnitine CoA-transferase CaiB-like acyl-CoA transferase